MSDGYYTGLREASGSFTISEENAKAIHGIFAGKPAVDLTIVHTYAWTRWQRFWNKFFRIWLWPFGPEPLPKEYEVVIKNAEIERTYEVDGGVGADFKVAAPPLDHGDIPYPFCVDAGNGCKDHPYVL